MSQSSRGRVWFEALIANVPAAAPATAANVATAASGLKTVLVGDAQLGGESCRFLAVVPDPDNRFPRARQGEVGLDEGWSLAAQIHQTLRADSGKVGRPIIAIVDVSSQAYGRREELLGIHLACAAAADAYATARWDGHPVIALIVGKAMSGAFLAHGYQANRILALDSPEVLIHAMGKQAAARVTRRTVAELEQLGERIPPMAYNVRAFASLGLVDRLIEGVDADHPSEQDLLRVRDELAGAIVAARAGTRDLSHRLKGAAAVQTRAASIEVRRRLSGAWDAD
jgi:malonate decarboxylase gamma subunit